MNDPVIDLHMLFVSKLGGMGRSFLSLTGVTALCP